MRQNLKVAYGSAFQEARNHKKWCYISADYGTIVCICLFAQQASILDSHNYSLIL